MTTEESLNDNVKQLVDEAKTFAESSIFAELEEGEEDNNKSWFQKFSGMSVVDEDVEAKFKDIHMTFPKILFKESGKGDRNKLEQGDLAVASIPAISQTKDDEQRMLRLNILTLVVRRTQTLVAKHASALELLPTLLNRMEDKITSLEKKLEEKPGFDHEILLHMVKDEVDKKTKEYDTKLKVVEDELNIVKRKNAELKLDNEKLEEEVDEARQRGMKGNIKVTCPPEILRSRMKDNGDMETKTESMSRVLQAKSGAHLPPSSMVALHPLPGEKNTHIVRVVDHSPDSGWESLVAGMVTNKRQDMEDTYLTKDEVYLNFQLTPARNDILYQVRQARKAGHLWRFSVNQNGRIAIIKDRPPPRGQQAQGNQPSPRVVVRTMKHLSQLLPAVTFPLGPPRATRPPGNNN